MSQSWEFPSCGISGKISGSAFFLVKWGENHFKCKVELLVNLNTSPIHHTSTTSSVRAKHSMGLVYTPAPEIVPKSM